MPVPDDGLSSMLKLLLLRINPEFMISGGLVVDELYGFVLWMDPVLICEEEL
jgi:hypothetical protein